MNIGLNKSYSTMMDKFLELHYRWESVDIFCWYKQIDSEVKRWC